MGDDGSAQSPAVWPLAKFHFSVDLGFGTPASFQEVSGLDVETQVIEYRHGNSPVFSPIKMPGIARASNVTLRKGLFADGDAFRAWHKDVAMNLVKRRAVTIDLLDEAGKTTMRWTLTNAWPTKLTSVDMKSDGNEVAIETIELAHEGLTVTTESQ